MAKWFTNNAKTSTVNKSVIVAPAPSTSKPRAVTAVDLFARDYATDIKQQMATKRLEEGTTPKESNLNYHREIKLKMFSDSDDTIKSRYESEAAALNAKRGSPPDVSEIYRSVSYLYTLFGIDSDFGVFFSFRNQEDILATTSAALRSLCGWDWGQHGDIALFLLGGFRDEKKKLKLFKYVISLVFFPSNFSLPEQCLNGR
jgi:hypothetical protein